jgi:hypothetical protein
MSSSKWFGDSVSTIITIATIISVTPGCAIDMDLSVAHRDVLLYRKGVISAFRSEVSSGLAEERKHHETSRPKYDLTDDQRRLMASAIRVA